MESLSPLLCAELVVSYGSLSAHNVHKHRFFGVIRHGVVIAVWVQQVHTFEAQCLWYHFFRRRDDCFAGFVYYKAVIGGGYVSLRWH